MDGRKGTITSVEGLPSRQQDPAAGVERIRYLSRFTADLPE